MISRLGKRARQVIESDSDEVKPMQFVYPVAGPTSSDVVHTTRLLKKTKDDPSRVSAPDNSSKYVGEQSQIVSTNVWIT